MAVGDTYEVLGEVGIVIWTKVAPDKSSKNYQTVETGTRVVEISGSTGGWIHISSGYLQSSSLKLISSAKVNSTTTNSEPVKSSSETPASQQDYVQEPEDDGTYIPEKLTQYDSLLNNKESLYASNVLKTEALAGVFGLPYQFLPSADYRVNDGGNSFDGDGIGYEYADRIATKMPILFLAPGRPRFMPQYNDDQKGGVFGAIIKESAGLLNPTGISGLEDLIGKDGKYYTFQNDNKRYYQFVNPMCRIASSYLGIENFNYGDGLIRSIHWGDYLEARGGLLNLTGDTEFLSIPFYLDSEPTVSESFDNTTTESSLASTVNGISDLARELRFLTGYSSAALDQNWFSQNADAASQIEIMNQEIEGLLGKGSFITNLTKHLNTVASGGRLIFPKIWAESGMSRSYNVTIKLVSPDANKLSIFLNILVPLFHLIGMVAPQSIPTNPNGYTNPFIVRAIYKSHFNVDMGIITDMQVSRGEKCMWTVEGIPTSIDVSLTIKDLYDVFTITEAGDGLKFETMGNTTQMDYIANLCGINMYKAEMGRQVTMYLYNEMDKVTDIPTNIWLTVNQNVTSAISNFFRGV